MFRLIESIYSAFKAVDIKRQPAPLHIGAGDVAQEGIIPRIARDVFDALEAARADKAEQDASEEEGEAASSPSAQERKKVPTNNRLLRQQAQLKTG